MKMIVIRIMDDVDGDDGKMIMMMIMDDDEDEDHGCC
jgi:hypothetical protein